MLAGRWTLSWILPFRKRSRNPKVSVQCIVTVKTVNKRVGNCRNGIENKTESPIVPLVCHVGGISPFLIPPQKAFFYRGQYRERQKDKETYSVSV